MSFVIEYGSSTDGAVPHVMVEVATRAEAETAFSDWQAANSPPAAGAFVEIYDRDTRTLLGFLEWDGSDWFATPVYPT